MRVITILAAGLFFVACTAVTGPGETPDSASPTDAPATDTPTPAPDTPAPPADDTFPPFDTEVPQEYMEAIVDEAAALGQVGLGDVTIVRAEAVTWADASLGCPEEDQMYAQVLTDGYWVIVEAGGQQYDFRMSETGVPRVCPQGQGQPPFEDIQY